MSLAAISAPILVLACVAIAAALIFILVPEEPFR